MKACHKCGETKPFTEFSKSTRYGLQSSCKPCARISAAAYRTANPDKKRESDAKWRAKNPGHNAKWKAANPDKVNEHRAKWDTANPEIVKASKTKWSAANPEVHRIHSHNRRARERANGGRLTHGLAAKLLKLQRGKCACCHVSIDDENHLDHVIPVALGGPNEDWNMQLLCPLCNLQKSAKHPVDFMQQKGFLL